MLEQMNDEELTTLLSTKNIKTDSLNTKNRRHVIRAIERSGQLPVDKELRKNTFVSGLTLQREVLKQRITQRIEQMFEDGFVHEVELLVSKYGWDNESMSGIGYRVMKDYIEGSATIEEAKEAFVRRDISLAKRQRTWFKRNNSIQWFSDPEVLIAKAVEFARTFDYN
jgi:tRNA dimethylallyltransferase